ncbi:MAG: hypothetical protein F6K19_00025 [Cyanothece sp. SIO1E1]|nr:hypothetical protein [Cyanothece sp. SIO1E1]
MSMNRRQRERRQVASKAFGESLDQLQESLDVTPSKPETPAARSDQSESISTPDVNAHPPSAEAAHHSLEEWADAIADLDQYMQHIQIQTQMLSPNEAEH